MALYNNGFKLGSGLAMGVGAVLLAPIVLPVAAGVMKTLAKSGIKGSIILYERGKVLAAEAKEGIEDLAAEAKSELEHQPEAAPAKKTETKKP